MKKLKGKELENYELIMNLLKKTRYWERLSKVPQVMCGHLYYLLNEREEIESKNGDEILSAYFKNGSPKYSYGRRKLRLIEITKDDKDFQIVLFCYNIIWGFSYKLGPDLLGNYNV